MDLYFETLHTFQNNNCTHDISIYKNKSDLKYKHNTISFCNSDKYENFNIEETNEFLNLYIFDNKNKIEDLWMVFIFYENTIISLNIYETLNEAKQAFDEILKESYYEPSNDEISVLEKDKENNQIYTLYNKDNGKYILPDKAQRIVLHKFNIYDESINL